MLGQDLCVSPSTVLDEFGIVLLKDTEAVFDAMTSSVPTITSGVPTISVAIVAVTNIVVAVIAISNVIVAVVVISSVMVAVIPIARVPNSVPAIRLLSEFYYWSGRTKCEKDRGHGELINRRHGDERLYSGSWLREGFVEDLGQLVVFAGLLRWWTLLLERTQDMLILFISIKLC